MVFADKHVFITGGSSGIGKEVGRMLAKEGASLTLVARNQTRLEKAKTEIEQSCLSNKQIIRICSADVSSPAEAEGCVRSAVNALGPPDIVITSAGIFHPALFADLSLEVLERSMAINYFGTLYVLKAVIPHMEHQGGQIVLLSSGVGLIGMVGMTAYSPTKFAIRGLAECLRAELKPAGVSVTIVYPPDTDTPLLHEGNKTKPAVTRRMTEIARRFSAQQVAKAIVKGIKHRSFLISPGLEMRLLARLHSLLLPLLQSYFDIITSRDNKCARELI